MQVAQKKNTNQTPPMNPTSTACYLQLQHHHPKLLSIVMELEMEPQHNPKEQYTVYTNAEVIYIQLTVQSVLEEQLIK
uniref:Uncharacterized protein n=1 Tax=Medicago truncatula TaxID=3880 RepID=I3T497_MEDTR|nr:unknown [Medicago truncatula]